MPLVIKLEGEQRCPAIVCDHCGQEVAKAQEGSYQWRLGEGTGAAIYFTHKACRQALEQSRAGPWGFMPLDCLLVYLANRLGLDWEAAWDRATLLGCPG